MAQIWVNCNKYIIQSSQQYISVLKEYWAAEIMLYEVSL